jgi:hypothetical protein
VKGLYPESADIFRQALGAGAPPIAHLDLGEALYRHGQNDEALAELTLADSMTSEPARELMKDYLLYRMGARGQPDLNLLSVGIPYWQDHSQRFRHTPYGEALAADVLHMRQWIENG